MSILTFIYALWKPQVFYLVPLQNGALLICETDSDKGVGLHLILSFLELRSDPFPPRAARHPSLPLHRSPAARHPSVPLLVNISVLLHQPSSPPSSLAHSHGGTLNQVNSVQTWKDQMRLLTAWINIVRSGTLENLFYASIL